MIQKHKIVAAESVVDTYMDEDIYTMVAGVEKNSEHPFGKAIVNCFTDIGILNPVIGALVHNAGSVFVIINSAFLLKWGRTK